MSSILMNEAIVNPSLQLSAQIRSRAVGEDGVLVHLDSARVIVVNEVGLHIVQQLANPVSRTDLAASIAAEFLVSAEQAEADLDSFLEELDQEQALSRG